MVQQSELEGRRADDLLSGNRLLATMSGDARDLVEPRLERVDLVPGDIVLQRGDQVRSTVFPLGDTMISMGVELAGGREIEVASVGREGAVGGIISCGHAPAFTRAVVLTGGPALKLPMEALDAAKQRSSFIANLFCRFSDFLLSQVMQSVACNAFHSIPERAARWLLHAQDRAGPRIELTQEGFADLLGVQRTTINAVIRALIDEGLITTGRGVIHVVDRDGLRRRSCECYSKLESHFAEVIGDTGFGPRG